MAAMEFVLDCIGIVRVMLFFFAMWLLYVKRPVTGFQNWQSFILIWARLFFYKYKTKPRLSYYDIKKEKPSVEDLGFVPYPRDYELENPQKYLKEGFSDGIHFFGVDTEHNFIDVSVTNIGHNRANVSLILKLSNGTVYQLPTQPDTRKPYIENEQGFSSSGLQIRCHAPLRRWRMSFNGLLRKTELGSKETEIVHVKFSFIWMGVSLVHDMLTDYEVLALAKSLSAELLDVHERDMTKFGEIKNYYEQWGQLMGTVQVDEGKEIELYLWSARTRNFSNPLWRDDQHCLKIFLYFNDGTPVKMEVTTLKNFMTGYFNGYGITAGGKKELITNCNLKLEQFKKRIPEKLFISFKKSGNEHGIILTSTEDNFRIFTGPCNEQTVYVSRVKARIDGDEDGYGIVMYTSRSKQQERIPMKMPKEILWEKGYKSENSAKVLNLESKLCQNSSVSGGKGCSLSLLTALSKTSPEFKVPKGFVVTTSAFECHIKMNEPLSDAIKRLSVSSGRTDGDIKAECERCCKEFTNTCLSDSLKSEVAAEISKFGSVDNLLFAVRSSACGEDSEDMSAAGQMLTLLGVKGLEKIYSAIIECWASHFRFEAVQYCRQYGQPVDSPMAVVVQEMVPADVAGVMFTVDPISGNPAYPCITANFGLGETVVSSTADPDTFTLKRQEDNKVLLDCVKKGTKKIQVYMQADGGVKETEMNAVKNKECLTEDWAIKIGNTGLLVEDCFCGPRDIEWAVHGEELFFLQARPITTLHMETEFELIHELDTPMRSNYEYWTRANTGEVFYGACSPLAISLIVLGMDIFGQRNFMNRQKPKNFSYVPFYCHWLPTTHRKVTLSLIDTLFRANERKITTQQKAFEVAFFGRTIASEDMHKWGVKKFGCISRSEKILSKVMLLYLSFKIDSILETVSQRVWSYNVPIKSLKSSKEAYASIQEQLLFYGEVSGVHGMATYLSSFYNVLLLSLLSKNKPVWDNELYCDFATLLSTCTDVESADVPSSMQELAKAISETDNLTFASVPVEVAHTLLKNDKGPAGKKFHAFLQKHGHRCLKEFDIHAISWGMEPQGLVKILQNMVKSQNVLNSVTKEVTTPKAAIEKLRTPLSKSAKLLLKIILPWSRKAVGHREKTKSLIIKAIDWIRRTSYHLGELLVSEGLLPNKELLFFLTFDEIKLLIETRNPNLVSRAVRRLRIHPKLDALIFPEIIVGIPKPENENKYDLEQLSASFELKGTPVCQGIVKARARVVKSLEEASEIKSGEILVAYSTDIGWSPYFPLLAGVITVLGGLISHGAVVAREYGLPCVVGVQKATTLLKTGDLIVLNGTKGKITKVDESCEANEQS